MKPRCVCGCGRRAVNRHHAIYVQHLRTPPYAGDQGHKGDYRKLRKDPRNLVWVARVCHDAHHNRSVPLRLSALPDSVFEFAAEVLGPGPGYEYLNRRYAGSDMRLERLLDVRCERNHPRGDADALGTRDG